MLNIKVFNGQCGNDNIFQPQSKVHSKTVIEDNCIITMRSSTHLYETISSFSVVRFDGSLGQYNAISIEKDLHSKHLTYLKEVLFDTKVIIKGFATIS